MLYHAKIGGRTIMMQGKIILVFQHTEFFFFHFCDEIVAKNCTTQQVNTTSEPKTRRDKHTIIIEKTYIVFTIDMLDKDKLE